MFRSKKHNIVTEELNKTALNANNGKRMKSMDYKETYVYRTSKNMMYYYVKLKRLNMKMQ